MFAEFSIKWRLGLGKLYLFVGFRPFCWRFNISKFEGISVVKSVLLYCGPFCFFIDIS